jgi:hypothetical protein
MADRKTETLFIVFGQKKTALVGACAASSGL